MERGLLAGPFELEDEMVVSIAIHPLLRLLSRLQRVERHKPYALHYTQRQHSCILQAHILPIIQYLKCSQFFQLSSISSIFYFLPYNNNHEHH